MKKILYIITQAEFGGAQRYVFDLATNLTENFEIVVAIGNPRVSEADTPPNGGTPNLQDDLVSKLTSKNIRVSRLKHLVREISPWHDLRAICEIKKLIKKEKPDVVHLNSTKTGFIGSLAAYLTGKKFKLVYTIHGWIFLEPLAAWRKKLYLALEKFSGRICDALIVLSQSELQTGLDNKICKADKLHLISHGIKPPEFLSKSEAREALQKISNFRFPISDFIVGTVANFYPTKGLPYLIEAVAKLKFKNHRVQSVIIGDGIERAYLESLIVKYNLEDNIILAGQIPEAAKYLKAFDIFVLPSVKEGLPYAILESMAAALPIVATAVGGVPEMITDNKDGLLVPPKSADELATAIEKLIDNPGLLTTLGANAEIESQKKFSLKRMLDATEKIYLN